MLRLAPQQRKLLAVPHEGSIKQSTGRALEESPITATQITTLGRKATDKRNRVGRGAPPYS